MITNIANQMQTRRLITSSCVFCGKKYRRVHKISACAFLQTILLTIIYAEQEDCIDTGFVHMHLPVWMSACYIEAPIKITIENPTV